MKLDKELSAKVWAWVCVAITLGVICALVYVMLINFWLVIILVIVALVGLILWSVLLMIYEKLIAPLFNFFYEELR